MRIAINALALGKIKAGGGRYISELINELARIDTENSYIIFTTSYGKEYLNVGENFHIHITTLPRPLRILWEQIVLPQLLKKYKIDVFHALGFTLPYLKTSKYIVTIHDMTWFDYPEMHQSVKKHYFQRMIPMSLKRADEIVAVSHNTKQDIVRFFPEFEHKVTTIYEAISKSFLKPNSTNDKNRQVLSKYDIPPLYIFCVGMIEPRKNLHRLIKAYHLLKEKYQIPHQLVITGQKGWKYQTVFKEIEALKLTDHVIFTGYVSDTDLACLYHHSDVFVYPSLYEGFGLPVIEAMAAGTVVVTSNNSSLKEIVGEAALLCDPYDVENIASEIWKIISDKNLKSQLKLKGKENISRFSWRKTARQTLAVYTRIFNS